jgi:hypothetical protein
MTIRFPIRMQGKWLRGDLRFLKCKSLHCSSPRELREVIIAISGTSRGKGLQCCSPSKIIIDSSGTSREKGLHYPHRELRQGIITVPKEVDSVLEDERGNWLCCSSLSLNSDATPASETDKFCLLTQPSLSNLTILIKMYEIYNQFSPCSKKLKPKQLNNVCANHKDIGRKTRTDAGLLCGSLASARGSVGSESASCPTSSSVIILWASENIASRGVDF